MIKDKVLDQHGSYEDSNKLPNNGHLEGRPIIICWKTLSGV